MAANYLDIKGLLDLTCQTVADMIKGKSPEEVRKTFNIVNDFTPEEEEEVRRENHYIMRQRYLMFHISYDVTFDVSQAIKSLSFSGLRKDNVAFRLQPGPQRFTVCCPAKQEIVDKVCDIVKKQLALADGTEVYGTSKFQDLGADSLDSVEIVMGLEEAFGITVESSAQSIATVEDAANLIDELVAGKSS
ncbi:hypothetical protein HU200_013592 [Digitaria exilis]|uniref:Acyl carrier protein n=1 Tax=Digitaria exilis TaxID=1010633 RepID=A0A835FDD0_9POAL|nr:hypothetical protein HU200_013592 [Digitaria exilis]